MNLELPDPLEQALRPVFEAIPIDRAMTRLVVNGKRNGHVELIEKALSDPVVADQAELAAGLWLYVDELDRSHRISQGIESPTGSYWHGIMHRREGDFSNSHYWFRRVGKHPAMARIEIAGGSGAAGTDVGQYDPHDFIDRVQQADDPEGTSHPDLVSLQRKEWVALFAWCAKHHG